MRTLLVLFLVGFCSCNGAVQKENEKQTQFSPNQDKPRPPPPHGGGLFSSILPYLPRLSYSFYSGPYEGYRKPRLAPPPPKPEGTQDAASASSALEPATAAAAAVNSVASPSKNENVGPSRVKNYQTPRLPPQPTSFRIFSFPTAHLQGPPVNPNTFHHQAQIQAIMAHQHLLQQKETTAQKQNISTASSNRPKPHVALRPHPPQQPPPPPNTIYIPQRFPQNSFFNFPFRFPRRPFFGNFGGRGPPPPPPPQLVTKYTVLPTGIVPSSTVAGTTTPPPTPTPAASTTFSSAGTTNNIGDNKHKVYYVEEYLPTPTATSSNYFSSPYYSYSFPRGPPPPPPQLFRSPRPAPPSLSTIMRLPPVLSYHHQFPAYLPTSFTRPVKTTGFTTPYNATSNDQDMRVVSEVIFESARIPEEVSIASIPSFIHPLSLTLTPQEQTNVFTAAADSSLITNPAQSLQTTVAPSQDAEVSTATPATASRRPGSTVTRVLPGGKRVRFRKVKKDKNKTKGTSS